MVGLKITLILANFTSEANPGTYGVVLYDEENNEDVLLYFQTGEDFYAFEEELYDKGSITLIPNVEIDYESD